MKLTKEQSKIIDSTDQHVACLANAGTGKSTVVVERVATIIEKNVFDPKAILVSSFSKMANKELRDKFRNRLGFGISGQINVRTLHSLCYHILLEHRSVLGYKDINIISIYQYAGYIRSVCFRLGIQKEMKECNALANEIENLKRSGKLRELSQEDQEIYHETEQMMFDKDEMTYTDVLVKTHKLFIDHALIKQKVRDRYSYVVIDESQDTSLLQWNIIEHLIGSNTHTMIVGDVKQNIYSWRGASYEYMDSFIKRHNSTILPLTETFRFGKHIADASNILIDNMSISEEYREHTRTNVEINHKPEYFVCDTDAAVMSICDDIENKIKQGYKYSDLHILYRLNKDSLKFQKELTKRKIPFYVQKGSFLDRQEIKFLINCIELLYRFDLNDIVAISAQFPNYVGLKTLETVHRTYGGDTTLDFLRTCVKERIQGLGYKRRKALEDLYDNFSKLSNYIETTQEFSFRDVANIMCIENTKFMFPGVTTTGADNIEERFEFISVLSSIYRESEIENVREFINFLKLDYQSSEEVSEKNAVNLKTVHGSKGQSLPIVYLYAYNIAAFYRMNTPEDILNELFLFYVAITRTQTKLNVYLSNPNTFQFGYVFDKMYQALSSEQEKMGKDNLFDESEIMLFENNYSFKPDEYLFLRDFKPVRKSEKAVLFINGSENIWISLQYLGYRKERFYVPQWMARRNNLSIA